MRTIHLHGSLKEKFGGPFRLDVHSPAEGVQALASQLPGFRHTLAQMQVKVIRGKELESGWELDEQQVTFQGGRHYHIVPIIHGSGGGGTGKMIVGAVLLAAAFIFAPPVVGALGPTLGMGTTISIGGFSLGITYSSLALMGGALLLSGVAMALAPSPKAPEVTQREAPEERPSFVFNGPVNTTEQGGPVPLVYGRHLVGSHVISAGISAVGVPVDNNSPGGNFASDWIWNRNPLA